MQSSKERQLPVSNKVNIHEVLVTSCILYKFSGSFQEKKRLIILLKLAQQIYWATIVHSADDSFNPGVSAYSMTYQVI